MRKPAAKKKATKSKVKNVIPKTYAGVQYKSSLEAYCAQRLHENGLPNLYESWKVVLDEKLDSQVESWEPKTKKNKEAGIKVRTFAPALQKLRQTIYTIDFPCLAEGWAIETKGLRTEAFNLRFRLFKRWLHEQGMHGFRLYMPGNQGEVDQAISHILSNRK